MKGHRWMMRQPFSASYAISVTQWQTWHLNVWRAARDFVKDATILYGLVNVSRDHRWQQRNTRIPYEQPNTHSVIWTAEYEQPNMDSRI